jgi:F0F1-type ATP synthase membrane subunit c/vacuolar-type H+-ATPase subunit K
MAVGCMLAHGQDPAGRGIGLGLGMLGAGIPGGILMAVFVSYSMVRAMRSTLGKILAITPWLIFVIFWWMALFTPTGDRLFEWVENLC